MKVKICGITNLEDARAASAAGADYLGFIFYPPSKRAVDVETAAAIIAALHEEGQAPAMVGVFVNETGPRMAEIMAQCRLDLAQLSGDEVPFLVGDPESPIFGRSYKALQPASLTIAEADAEWFLPKREEDDPPPEHPTILIDSHHPSLRGGTGHTGDWQMAARLAETIAGLMLAGGLTAANVAAAVRQVRPFGVDVASGVEAGPGRKDHALVRAFIHQAKAAAGERG